MSAVLPLPETAPTERWRRALCLPGEDDPVESGLAELAAYFGIGREQARLAAAGAVAASRREWESAPRRTPAEVLAFYRATRSYIFEHVHWHATDLEGNAGNVAILDHARRRGVRRYLDFGAGVGANALLFAAEGIAVTLADVSSTMLDFTRWRLARRGLAASFVDLNESELPAGGFDLVTAVDVLEHLAEPGREIARVAAALAPGGLLVYNDCTGPDPERPMHIVPSLYPVLRALRVNGLREAPAAAPALTARGYRVAVKPARRRLADRAWGFCDGVRYGPLGLLAKRALAQLSARRAAGGGAGAIAP